MGRGRSLSTQEIPVVPRGSTAEELLALLSCPHGLEVTVVASLGWPQLSL